MNCWLNPHQTSFLLPTKWVVLWESSSSSSPPSFYPQLKKNCSPWVCSRNNPPIIKFPFYQEDSEPEPCGYPGFDVRCSSLGETVLSLPLSGDFFISDIDYFEQEVLLYDPDNCLPKRLLDLDLSDSPFEVGELSENLTFLNCTSDFLESKPIKCLSSPNHTVFVVSTTSMVGASVPDTCKLIKTAVIPTPRQIQYGYYGSSSGLGNNLWLGWRKPNCMNCQSRGGICGLSNNTSLETGCFNLPSRGESTSSSHRNLPKGLAIGVGISVLMLTIVAISYFCIKVTARVQPPRTNLIPNSATVLPQPAILTIGIDRATIESYPKVVLGESRRLPRPDDGTCSICLAEYRANDTLRSIPECQHFFHADCVDKWLQMNATCPVCRNSPQKQANAV